MPHVSAHGDGGRNLVGKQNSNVHGRNQVRRECFRARHHSTDHHAQRDRSEPAAILPCGATRADDDYEAHGQWWQSDGEEWDRTFSIRP